MLVNIKNYLVKRYMPRWLVFLFDLYVTWFTFLLAYILRLNFDLAATAEYLNVEQMGLVILIFSVSYIFFKSYSGIVRQSTAEDIARIILSLGVGSAVFGLLSYLLRIYLPGSVMVVPLSVVVIHFALASNLLLASRIWVKSIYNEWFVKSGSVKQIMIYGAGKLGQVAHNALKMDKSVKINLVGFIDDTPSLRNKFTAGAPIFSLHHAFQKVIPRHSISEIIIAADNQEQLTQIKRELVNRCLPLNITIKVVPTVNRWINGELRATEIKKVNIEELLGRDSIQLNCTRIANGLSQSVILVAGAAGSIGSEIVRQLISFKAYHVVLLDKAESDLYDLQNELLSNFKKSGFTIVVGDVTNPVNMRHVFEKYTPDIVINAAAYKHVPLMETFPNEAIRVNVGGTRNLADLSVEFGVKKFVYISTDKAVNPTNVMGTTKRIAEIYVQSLAQSQKVSTRFITTRFGNVLGSRGSVIPLFRKQIEKGGPVTVTHKDINRFFMTIPEACQLVLEASFMGKGGEIFVFDMGDPVRIYDLAEKMIFLSGFIPHEDIKIDITGLRPGEKLYEELLMDQEGLIPTHNDKIMIGSVRKHDFIIVNEKVTNLLKFVDIASNYQLVNMMKELVPEYVPTNSPFSALKRLNGKAGKNGNKNGNGKDKEKVIDISGMKRNKLKYKYRNYQS